MSKAFTREDGDALPDDEPDGDDPNPVPAGSKNYLTPAGSSLGAARRVGRSRAFWADAMQRPRGMWRRPRPWWRRLR